MQTAVNKALAWGAAKGLEFSPSKTVAVIFTRKRKFTPPRAIEIGGIQIPYTNTVKYLGVTLDSKLSWSPHITQKIRSAKAATLKVSNAMGKIWGMPPHHMKWAYTGIIRPALTYGSLVWSKVCELEWVKKALNRLNRLALLTLGHFRRSTPTAGLEVICDLMPLDLHIKSVSALAEWRTRGTRIIRERYLRTESKFLAGHRQYIKSNMDMIAVDLNDGDAIAPEQHWGRRFIYDASTWDGQPKQADITIFTDGSFYQGRAGCGFGV